ncbi:hypothetical protein FPANT_1675 [Fusarium pseudoanthophilum]|uniref:Uncharacterized protein n=1 Tax=Fusarium pseudoanthophilum TaxID=48495 RepID=A0A8H5UXC1_9HYPO|nr:hypothetical protein FPANT_1675 [Fusarium pseudoanthophilum]
MDPTFFVIPCVLSPPEYQEVRNAYYLALLSHLPPTRTFPRAVERRAYRAYKRWDLAKRRLVIEMEDFGAGHGHLYELSRAEIRALRRIVSRLIVAEYHHCAGRATFLRDFPWAFGSLTRRQKHKDYLEEHVADLET